MTPSQIVWLAHGSPTAEPCSVASGRCYVCAGELTRGALVADWLSTNFTDQNRCRMPAATHVCEACVYVQSRTSPVLGRQAKEGKRFGGNFRNYSHCCDERGYFNASKGEKPLLREFLARDHAGPWFAAIADSGQKHVLPFAPMNGRGRSGRVLFEDTIVHVPDDQSLIPAMTALLTSGVTKDELDGGEYYVRTMRERRAEVDAFEREHGSARHSEWFRLALWLSQRDEDEHARRQAEKEARDAHNRADSGAARRVSPRAKRAPANGLLDQTPGSDPKRSKANGKRERMGKPDAAQAPDRKPRQGRLEGID